ncbi:fibronectin type III domain-containing protein [Bdellovibrio bacteriovorus]|uniref:fibronectin type III domain-containing protein n=1 Tax=Bdellovibrio bacteriovorus TaxID=959 RepID=UPI0035A61A2A
MRKFILLLFLLCVSCTKPLGEEDPLNQPSSEAPGAFNLATIQRFDHQLLVSWSTSKGASSYELKYGTAAGTYTNSIKATKSPVVIESGLVPGTTYYFRVTASNDIGTVDSTSEKSYPFMGAPGAFELQTVIPGNTEVTLTWDASPEASSYTVMYGTSASNITTSAGTSLTTAKTITALTNGTTYHFSVTAKNAAGTATSTNTLSATPSPPPSAPLNLTATADSSKCTLTWEAPTTGTAPFLYTVRRITSPTTDVAVCTNTPLLTCEETIAAGTYEYTVEATNTSGTGAKSSAVSCSVGLPGAFQMLTASPGNGTVALTWEASSLATAYTVRYGTSAGDISTVASAAATSPYTVTGLTNMVPYHFSVTATNAQGSKISTNTLSATPNIPPTVPLSPTVTVPEVGKCTLNWMPPASGAPPITYTVRRIVNPSVNVVICENISTRTCSEEGLSGGTYNYTIEAINSVGTGPATSNISCNLAAPAAVTLSSITGGSIGNKKITLTWTGGSGSNSFTVKYGTTNPPTTVASTSATSPYIVENLTNGTLYYFRAEAVNAYGTTASASQSATPVSTQPNITIQGPALAINTAFNAVTFGDTYTRKFTIADPDPEDTIDCSGTSATSSNTGVIPNGNISMGGSGLNCSVSIASSPGIYGQSGILLNATDGQATRTLNISMQALPTPSRIYSWRKRGNYSGPALTVRRISDNNTTDIYFDSHGMVDPYLTTFAGTTGRLVTWYDQGSQGKHAYQTDPNRQPVVTLSGGILRITADGVDDSMTVPDFPTPTAMTVYTHFTFTTQATAASLLSFGKKEALGLEGFEIGRTAGGAWTVTSALNSSTLETTSGPALSTSSPGQAMILNTGGSAKRNLITSTATTATPTTSTGTLSGYEPSTNADAYLFSGGTSGTTLPIKGYIRELLIFDQELSTSEVKALTTQN